MRERPILFNGAMVRAILAGQKTQMRRAVKWNDVAPGLNMRFTGLSAQRYPKGWVLESDSRTSSEWRCQPTPCPFGQPGDRLWVRESFIQGYPIDSHSGRLLQFDADGNELPMTAWYRATDQEIGWEGDSGWQENPPWRPSVHMPRSLCRLVLEITAVRVERLQAISEADAKAEGIQPDPVRSINLFGCTNEERAEAHHRAAVHPFREIWTSTGGDWDSNPWVWVIEFKRVEVVNG